MTHRSKPGKGPALSWTFLAQPVEFRPGSVFLYNSAATYMLSAIVQKVTGQRVPDYLRPRFFSVLGLPGVTTPFAEMEHSGSSASCYRSRTQSLR